MPKIYGERVPDAQTVATLPAYVPQDLVARQTPPLHARHLDVGYRGRSVPYWLGRLGHEKAAIGREFLTHVAPYGLRCDISVDEDERIYGQAWYRFLESCRATLGTESGASIADYDGAVENAVKTYLVRHPHASFDELERDVLSPYEGNVMINVISSRIFEAAALRTAMILFPGDYSGAIEPWRHYIPLERDFANIAEVVERVRDLPFLEAVTSRAYADLIASDRYSLRRFVEQFDAVVDGAELRGSPEKRAFRRASLRRALPPPRPPSRLRFAAGKAAQPLAMATLVARDRAVRQLGLAVALDRELRARVGVRRLAGDLWRLAALRRGHALGLFDVSPTVECDGSTLILTSRPPATADGGNRVEVADGQIDAVVWNHALVADTVPLLGRGSIPTSVGTHGVSGAHAFQTVVQAWQRFPDAARTTLEPLLGERAGG